MVRVSGPFPFALIFALSWASNAAAGQAVPPAPATSTPPLRWQVRDTTRVETWRYFEPKPGGGDPDYTFVANRLLFSLDCAGRASSSVVACSTSSSAACRRPRAARDHSAPVRFTSITPAAPDSRQVYLRTLQLRLKNLAPGVDVQMGRFGYTSGGESPSGDPKIEAVKRLRLDTRLIGEFEWSLYQRTFDGVRLDVSRPQWHGTASAFRPTQGGFEEQAGHPLHGVGVAALTFTLRPSPQFRHTDWQGFGYLYDDTRDVSARPDNTLLPASAVDVRDHKRRHEPGGGLPCRRKASSIRSCGSSCSVASGTASTTAPEPWLPKWAISGRRGRGGRGCARAGFARPETRTPATIPTARSFRCCPPARKYSLSTTYNLMNLTELFGQALLRPRADVGVRLDVHRLRLTNAADLWYSGSGATQSSGTIFGFAGRRSNGSNGLGTMVGGRRRLDGVAALLGERLHADGCGEGTSSAARSPAPASYSATSRRWFHSEATDGMRPHGAGVQRVGSEVVWSHAAGARRGGGRCCAACRGACVGRRTERRRRVRKTPSSPMLPMSRLPSRASMPPK